MRFAIEAAKLDKQVARHDTASRIGNRAIHKRAGYTGKSLIARKKRAVRCTEWNPAGSRAEQRNTIGDRKGVGRVWQRGAKGLPDSLLDTSQGADLISVRTARQRYWVTAPVRIGRIIGIEHALLRYVAVEAGPTRK